MVAKGNKRCKYSPGSRYLLRFAPVRLSCGKTSPLAALEHVCLTSNVIYRIPACTDAFKFKQIISKRVLKIDNRCGLAELYW